MSLCPAALLLALPQQSEEPILSPETESLHEQAAATAVAWRLSTGVKQLFGAGFDSASGSVDVRRWSAALTLVVPTAEDDGLAFTPYARRYEFDFDGRSSFGPAPFGDIDVQGLDVDGWKRLAANLSVEGSVALEQAEGAGARLGSTSTKLLGYAAWDVTESFTLFLGAFHLQGIEDSFTVPIVGFDWDFFESLGLVSDEEGTRLEYRPDPRVRIDLGFDGDVFQARLGPGAAVPDGVLQYIELDLGARVVWQPEEGIQLAAGLLVDAFANIELQDAGGGFRGDDLLEPAPVVFLSLRLTF